MPPTLHAFVDAIGQLNETFPCPDLVLRVSELYDVRKEYGTKFPNSDSPGVYALVADDEIEVLRIGMAQTLGSRLASYFNWADREQGRARTRDLTYNDVQYLVTIPVPVNRAFEVPSIEAFLLMRFRDPKPRLNVRIGRAPLDDLDDIASGRAGDGV